MALKLRQLLSSDEIYWLLVVMDQEWPDKGLFAWADGESLTDKARWIAVHANLWTVWSGKSLNGYIAAEDLGRGRWSVHFGNRRGRNLGREMILVWRIFLKIAHASGVHLLVAYIPGERSDIERMARIFKFRQFKKLWASQRHQISSLHLKQLQQSRRRMKM